MTKEQYDIIRNAINWIGCLDGRYVDKMEEAFNAANEALNDMRGEESWSDEEE